VSPHPPDPPHRRVRLPPFVALGGEPGKRLAEGLPHREERYRLAQRLGRANRERKPAVGGLADGVAQERGLSDARFALDQQHAANPALRA
jgi:hypothetical protein